jgi:hypothetical protein
MSHSPIPRDVQWDVPEHEYTMFPAMQNFEAALVKIGLGNKVK